MNDVSPTGVTAQAEPPSPAVSATRRRRRWLGALTVIFLLCGVAYGAYWAIIDRFEESTDDAYVAGNVVPLTTRMNGTVIAIRADNTQRVQEGQPLVLLDSTDARITLDRAEAQLAQDGAPGAGSLPDRGSTRSQRRPAASEARSIDDRLSPRHNLANRST